MKPDAKAEGREAVEIMNPQRLKGSKAERLKGFVAQRVRDGELSDEAVDWIGRNVSLAELQDAFSFIPIFTKPYPCTALVEARDHVAIKYRWIGHRRRDKWAARRFDGQRWVTLHRWIAERAYGAPPPDHVCQAINGDYLDCRRSNLRWAPKIEVRFGPTD